MERQVRNPMPKLPLVPILTALVLGILLQNFLLHLHHVLVSWLILLGLCTLLLVLLKLDLLPSIRSKLYPFFALCSFVLLGICITATHDIRTSGNWFGHYSQEANAYSVEVIEAPREKPRTILLLTQVNFVRIEQDWKSVKGKLLVYVYKSEHLPDFKLGQKLIIPATLVPLKHNNNPGSFDFSKKQNRDGLYYQCFLSADDIFITDTSFKQSWLVKLREHLLHQLDTYIPEANTRALTEATLLNESEGLDAQMQADYANTGISHIIAISGMHVNMLFGLLVLLLFWMRGSKYQKVKYLLILPFVWIYIALCNFPPSAVRAGIGFTLTALALLFDRRQNALHILSLNAIIMLMLDPMYLFHIGVQLSFLAVLSILIFYPKIKRLIFVKNYFLRYAWEAISVSLAVQVLVFPLVMFYFHQFPIWFLPANLFAAIFSLIQMLIAFLIMLFGVLHFDFIAALLGKLLVFISLHFNALIAWLNEHTPDLSRMIPLDIMEFCLLFIIIVLLSIFWLQRQVWSLFTGLLLLLLFTINFVFQENKAAKHQRLIVFSGTRQSTIAYIEGKTAWVSSDSIDRNIEQYALRPAYLENRIRHIQKETLANHYWRLGDKALAFLSNSDSLPQVQLDYLILSKQAKLDPALIAEKWPLALVILDASFGRMAAIKYAQQLELEGLRVFVVAEQGAWWYYAK